MTDRSNPETSNDLIRITLDEANSSHVDDLLKREMALRGTPGVTRDRRAFYYQNWFVLMLAGTIAAIIAWAIIEPFFDDFLYLQGSIEEINIGYPGSAQPVSDDDNRPQIPIADWIVVKGQRVYIFEGTKVFKPDGSNTPINPGALRKGQKVGVYLEYPEEEQGMTALGMFLVFSPPPQSANIAAMTISQLQARKNAASLLMFPLVAGFIGLSIGAADGIICRLLQRALLAGTVGFLVGFIGGFFSIMVAGLVYLPLNALASHQGEGGVGTLTAFGFFVQMTGRSIAWALAGTTMALGQGIALRSSRLVLFGLLGGVVGGLLGGMLFDPIDLILLGPDKPSAHVSRCIGFAVIGATIGAMIGVVELLARDAWLRMIEGPLAGKEFFIFKDVMKVGSSPRCDIYLFNDPQVADHHATLRSVGNECELQSMINDRPVLLNSRPVYNARLHHGDQMAIGRTVFLFQKREG